MGYIIKTRDDFYINGVSALTVGLSVEMPQPPPMAAPRYTDYNVLSDEDICVFDDQFDPINYTITAKIIKNPDDFDNSAIYKFIQGAKTLQISRLPNYFFKVQKVTGIVPVARVKGNEIVYNIGFQLAPFKYHISDDAVTHTGTGDTFTVQNDGTRYCKPVYTFTLSSLTGLGGFIVNGQGVVISLPQAGISSTNFVIDTERMAAYYGTDNLANAMMYTAGAFPFLASGTNFMVLNGIISAVSIKRNQRSY